MFDRFYRRGRWAGAGALVLSLVIASEALALSWASPVPLSSANTDVFFGDLATAGGTAVAAYSESGATDLLFVRRSTDGGTSWKAPVLLSSNGMFPAVAGYGSSFDVIWNTANGRLRYARSTDGGATFSPSVPLSPLGRYTWRPAVARGPGGIVAVIWEDVASGAINVRVSTNGGASFGAATTLSTRGEEMGVGVAVGEGVIYAAYSTSFERLRLKRSTNNGLTWSTAKSITDQLTDDGISLTAAGSRAFIAYTTTNSYPGQFFKVRYRSTASSGTSWSPQHDLAPQSWSTSDPDLALQGGVLRATFTRCTTEFDICVDSRVFYRQRVLGSAWSSPERVSPVSLNEADRSHVGRVGKTLVLYVGDFRAYVRAGTP